MCSHYIPIIATYLHQNDHFHQTDSYIDTRKKSNTNSAGQKPTFPFFQVLASSFWIVRYHQFRQVFFCKFFSGHNLKMINTHVSNPPTFPCFISGHQLVVHPTSNQSLLCRGGSLFYLRRGRGHGTRLLELLGVPWRVATGGKGMDVMCSTVDLVNQRKSKHVFGVCSICFFNVICKMFKGYNAQKRNRISCNLWLD